MPKLRLFYAFLIGSAIVSIVGLIQMILVYQVPFQFKVFILPALVGGVVGILISSFKIKTQKLMAELEISNQKLSKLAYKDGLTEISNRRAFDDRIKSDWARWNRNKICFSLALLDIDFFKNFNDEYGHVEGDRCLKLIANVLNNLSIREDDFVARYGGEEFIIILPNANLKKAKDIAQRVHESIKTLNIEHSASTCSNLVTVSVGIVSSNESNNFSSFIKMIEAADKALYFSKKNGKNQTSTFIS